MTHEKHVAERYSICYNTNEGTTRNGVGGQPSQEGFAALLLKSKGVLPMSINELIGLLGAFASFFGLGYMIGSDKAKK